MAEMMGKRGEKTQFSITCELLRQYLKEKGSFGSIGLDIMAPRPLHHQPHGQIFRSFPSYKAFILLLLHLHVFLNGLVLFLLLREVPVSHDFESATGRIRFPCPSPPGRICQDSFKHQVRPRRTPQLVFVQIQMLTLNRYHCFRDTEKSSQLTIFYGGKVLVFDDFPADKAKDLLQMAGKESTVAPKLGLPAPSSINAAESSTQTGLPKPSQANSSGKSQHYMKS
ncbi:hypothetical protein BHE74_00029705 [Ensete ventricosum]|nr:hypothetical protein GW17_00010420 [Ensete ventricosum]RWW63133.1 hypothetical protein BHE74_00029705 [Ensete ventricosum]RZR88527.1 hypothetical protein BHM03_00016124 [Ensete ventricosum]